MTMRLTCTMLPIMAMLALAGCAHERQAPASATDKSVRQIDPSGLLAFRQQAAADLVVDFLDWNELSIVKPSTAGAVGAMNRELFLKSVGTLPIQKRLAVVVMDKRWSISSHRVSLEELEDSFLDLGFERIVFQQARSIIDFKTGLPILRDTEERH